MIQAIDFWIWFKNNKESIENFLHSDFSDYTPYENLTAKASEFNEYVVPEITMDEHDNFVLILSCDGMMDGIPKVEELYNAAFPIEKWVIKKFRQKGEFYGFSVNGIVFEKGDVLVSYSEVPNTGKLLLDMYMKGYSDSDKRFDVASVVYLDHNIGEYNSMTKIYNINLKTLNNQAPNNLISLQELAEVVEKM